MSSDINKRYLSISELSQYLGVSINTLYSWNSRGGIPHIKLGRLVKYDIKDIDEWMYKKKEL